MSFFYTRTRDGDEKTVGPFRTLKQTQRAVARALVDNQYAHKDDALRLAQDDPCTPPLACGVTYEIHEEER